MIKSRRTPIVEPIRLRFSGDKPEVVAPQDEDRYYSTASEAASACRQGQNMLRWKSEFDRFLAFIHEWCKNHSPLVVRAYVAFSSEGLNVFLLTQGPDYRFDFDDAVSELDIAITNMFTQCPAEVSHFPAVPVESLSSFFDSGKAVQLYGE